MIKAVVGANWGDEGKGKITDMLAQEADIIVRFQGGANAGHTIVNDYGKFALHTLPSGVFYNHTTSVIGNGVALNIPVFFKEYNEVIENAYEELAPHKICAYIYDLANAFNRFYHETKILGEENAEKQKSYIALLKVTKDVLEGCIDVLGFEAPERM